MSELSIFADLLSALRSQDHPIQTSHLSEQELQIGSLFLEDRTAVLLTVRSALGMFSVLLRVF